MIIMVGSVIDFDKMQNLAIEELKRINGSTILGFKIDINLASFVKENPKILCDCLKCYLLRL